MSKKTQKKATHSWLDKAKWLGVLILLALAIGGNVYWQASVSGPVRAAIVLIVVIVALLLAVTTYHGGKTWQFIKDAKMEMRKVVWPTRQETIQATVMVIAVVAITALILWGVDSIFALTISKIVI